MGQRVNIQYSVELEDLQDEVNRLFGAAIIELDSVTPVGGTPVVKLGTDGLEKLEFIRHRLAKIDIMLGDVQNIVEGYVRFKTQPEPERDLSLQQTPEELEVEQLENKIQMFRKALDENTNSESTV